MRDSRRSGNAILWTLVLIALVILAFYLGSVYGTSIIPQPSAPTSTTTTPAVTEAGSEYYGNTAEWQVYTDDTAGYSIAYPIDFSTDEPASPSPSTDWLANNPAQAPGLQTFTLTIPAAFLPQTNFVDATLSVGYSENDVAIANCLNAQSGEATSTSETIGNATFDSFTSSNPGAGQLYDTTSYRATHAGACYAIEYTIHSAELGNFPSSYDLQQFDEGEVTDLLNRIVGTFTFL